MPAETTLPLEFRCADWLRDYRMAWLRLDLVAGLTAAAVVIPKAMAYSTIACLPVQVGLYTAFMPMIYATLGVAKSHWRRIRATA